MEHPNSEKLEKYSARELSAEEMTKAILHLDSCAECFGLLQNILSRNDENTENFGSVANEKTIEFHLDYEEYLRPFIDNEADRITREIVESHTQVCANCAFQLRELREFSESLRLQELEKKLTYSPTFWGRFGSRMRQISQSLVFQTAFALLFILTLAAIFWFRSGQPVLTENRQKSVANETVIIKQDSNKQNDLKEIEKQSTAESNQNSNRLEPLIAKTENQNPKAETQITGNFDELQNLPAKLREKIQKVLRYEKLEFPPFLTSLQTNVKNRGESGAAKTTIYPNGEAVRSVSPTLNWKSFAKNDEKYIVKIFDEKFNQIAVSEPLRKNDWSLPVKLERGNVYHWEVSTASGGSQAKFKVLNRKSLNEIISMENKTSSSPLIRGIAYSSVGLSSEAKKAFALAIRQNSNSKTAEKLLRQIK